METRDKTVSLGAKYTEMVQSLPEAGPGAVSLGSTARVAAELI